MISKNSMIRLKYHIQIDLTLDYWVILRKNCIQLNIIKKELTEINQFLVNYISLTITPLANSQHYFEEFYQEKASQLKA